MANNSRNPLWLLVLKAIASIVASWVATIAGGFLYYFSWTGDGLLSQSQLFLAYLLCWPIFLIQLTVFGTVKHVGNFDPVVFGRLGWFAMWVYYYGLLALGIYLVRLGRKKAAARHN